MELPPEVHVEAVAHATVALDGFVAHVASAGEGEPVVLPWYQQALAAPVAGPRVVRRLGSPSSRVGRWLNMDRLTVSEREGFVSRLREPERVAAGVGLYRDTVRNAGRLPLTRFYRRAHLTVPTLAIHGADEHVSRPELMRLSGVKAESYRLELLDGVGYFVPDEAPERVESLVREFLAA